MVRYIVLLMLMLPLFTIGQIDVFAILSDATTVQPMYKDVDSIYQKEYVLKLNQNYSVDTILNLGGKDFEYQFDRLFKIYIDGLIVNVTSLNNQGDTVSIGYREYREDGLLLRDRLIHYEGYMKPMDRDKRYFFDEETRLIGSVNRLCDSCAILDSMYISYREDGMADTLVVIKKEVGDLIYTIEGDHYKIDRIIAPEYAERMKQFGQTEKDIPQEYVQFEKVGNNIQYKGFKEDKEKGQFILEWVKTRNAEGRTIAFEYYKEGELVADQAYELDENGTILKVTNVTKDVSVEFDNIAPLKYTYKKEGSSYEHTAYNEDLYWIKKWTKPTGVSYYEKWSTRTYFYKKR